MSGLAIFGLVMAAFWIGSGLGILLGGLCGARDRADLEAQILELERRLEP